MDTQTAQTPTIRYNKARGAYEDPVLAMETLLIHIAALAAVDVHLPDRIPAERGFRVITDWENGDRDQFKLFCNPADLRSAISQAVALRYHGERPAHVSVYKGIRKV